MKNASFITILILLLTFTVVYVTRAYGTFAECTRFSPDERPPHGINEAYAMAASSALSNGFAVAGGQVGNQADSDPKGFASEKVKCTVTVWGAYSKSGQAHGWVHGYDSNDEYQSDEWTDDN